MSAPRAYGERSKYKPGDLIRIWKSHSRFADCVGRLEEILKEESHHLGEAETSYVKNLIICFKEKRNTIK